MAVNNGILKKIEEAPYKIETDRKFYLFELNPMGAVRMTRSDKWKTDINHINPLKRQRKAVHKYFTFKTSIQLLAKSMGYELRETLEAVYVIQMPNSWSKKKKDRMNGLPCKVKPDTDNITKAIKDALKVNDSDVWYEKAEKRWGFKGAIIIYE